MAERNQCSVTPRFDRDFFGLPMVGQRESDTDALALGVTYVREIRVTLDDRMKTEVGRH